MNICYTISVLKNQTDESLKKTITPPTHSKWHCQNHFQVYGLFLLN